ncbi:hypothetical protein RA19_22860 [Leisingera sp. ANG-M1]|uniref:hypothetical protein n=1 Tax=Leisingera sp. ANG-M1 TaxID=1577895 RepID=UPI00057D47AF|nr:hypothetical protein [Leisingera sp. ANG-M1]KIC07641.1 hypothetical protein RA19_22860 [Leisingera sp. ANG-M1]
MPLNEPVTPGIVDWTGENPGILLKDENGDFSAMALFFRVAWSPAGQGQVLLLYGTPSAIEGPAEAPNVILSDNPALTAFLKENFIGKLAAFANAPAFATLPELGAQAVRSSGDPMGHRYTETIAGEGLTVELVWEQLEAPRALELTPDQVGTGEHTMFTLLVPAHAAQIIVNGRSLPGQLGTRVQAGYETTTAFLYFSETWVIPPEAA